MLRPETYCLWNQQGIARLVFQPTQQLFGEVLRVAVLGPLPAVVAIVKIREDQKTIPQEIKFVLPDIYPMNPCWPLGHT